MRILRSLSSPRPYLVTAALLLTACGDQPLPLQPMDAPRASRSSGASAGAASVVDVATLAPVTVITNVGGTDILNGGFGSALAVDPHARGDFFLLSDRGPVYGPETAKVFPIADFAPQIARFRLDGGVLRLVERIPLAGPDGTPLSGLPSAPAAGGTGEVPVSVAGARLPFDPNGIDPEGLVVMKDGTFWVSDEYGPHLAHLDRAGRTIERVSPSGTARQLPAALAKRRPNRGMEGLAVLPDGKILVGAMQSPLDNPRAAGRSSRITRLVTFDTRTGETQQFVYVLEHSSLLNSEVTALTQNTLLTLERDGAFLGAGPAVKRVYKIDLRGATDVSDAANSATGRLYGGRTLEQLAPEELAQCGIVPVRKELVVDLAALGYLHDKAEGLAVIDNFTIAVSNDDDFGVSETPNGVVPKVVPGLGGIDRGTVWFVRVPEPLRAP